MNRRQFILAAGAATAGCCGLLAACSERASPRKTMEDSSQDSLRRQVAAIEAQTGGRLGVAVIDTQTGTHLGYRADERFPMCSTFKFLVAAAVLSRVDGGREKLDRRIAITQKDLLEYAPVTRQHVGSQMTVAEICEAMMTLSDNTAANLMLRDLGGPAALTAYIRSMGDSLTRLDRYEPELNTSIPGDPRDTTTPAAMAKNLQSLLLQDKLSAESRKLLTQWMLENKTGAARLRAGLPADWRIGDKTGSGDFETTNDIAILWPPGREPLLVAAYLTGSTGSRDDQNAALAKVAKVIAG